MATSSAPGKVFFYGEHAVVYGEPAVLAAVDLRATVTVEQAEDGDSVDAVDDRYVLSALEAARNMSDYSGGFSVEVDSEIPVGAGLGSSAAVTVATLHAALREVDAEIDAAELAAAARDVERAVQGSASQADTYTSLQGGFTYVSSESLRPIDASVDAPIWVAWDGESADTGEMVDRVRRFVDDSRAGDRVVGAVGEISKEGRRAVVDGDISRVGRLMDVNHGLLESLGVSTASLSRLVWTAREAGAKGAKLTGAGGGGCVLALDGDVEEAWSDAEDVYRLEPAEGVRPE